MSLGLSGFLEIAVRLPIQKLRETLSSGAKRIWETLIDLDSQFPPMSLSSHSIFTPHFSTKRCRMIPGQCHKIWKVSLCFVSRGNWSLHRVEIRNFSSTLFLNVSNNNRKEIAGHYAFWKQLSESTTLSKKDLAAHTAQLHENQAVSMTHGAKPHESYAIQYAQEQQLCDETAQPW